MGLRMVVIQGRITGAVITVTIILAIVEVIMVEVIMVGARMEE